MMAKARHKDEWIGLDSYSYIGGRSGGRSGLIERQGVGGLWGRATPDLPSHTMESFAGESWDLCVQIGYLVYEPRLTTEHLRLALW